MENSTHAIEHDANTRSPAFRNFRPVVQKHGFNIRPYDVGSLLEDRFQHALVSTHCPMISRTDIISRIPSNPDFLYLLQSQPTL